MPDRPYQLAAVETVRALWGQGRRRVLMCAPVGAGKTRIFELLAQRVVAADWADVIFVAHTGELVLNPADRLRRAGLRCGVVKAGHEADPLAKMQSCSVFSLVNRPVTPTERRDGRLHARCVLVVDECFPANTMVDDKKISEIQVGDLVESADSTGRISKKRVTRVFKKNNTGLLCVLYTDTGYVLRCTEEHPIYTGPKSGFVPAHAIKYGDSLYGKFSTERGMQGIIRWPVCHADLFKKLRNRLQEETLQTRSDRVLHVQEPAILARIDQSSFCQNWSSVLLRWGSPPFQSYPREGQEEGKISIIGRVDRIEILEPGGARRWLEEVCCDDQVYNLEVEDDHTYFANGVLVHNCHRVRASTYVRLLDTIATAYDHVYALLMTATPYRGDGRGMSHAADVLVEVTTPRELVEAGVLVEPEYYSRPPPEVEDDPTAVRPALPKIVGDPVAEWVRHAGGVPTIARCANRAHAADVAARFAAAGVRSATIDGTVPDEAREVLFARLAVERAHPLAVEVLCSGGTLLEEGYDSASTYRHVVTRPALWRVPGDPRWDDRPPAYEPLACLVDLAPTNSRGAWVQRLGRVCRVFTEADAAEWASRGLRAAVKHRAVVLCLSGNLERHGFLCQHEGFRLLDDRPGAPAAGSSAYPSFRPPQTATCPACFASFARPATACPVCRAPVSAPSLPDEDASQLLRRRVWDPTSAPPPTDEERTAFLRVQWARFSRARAERVAQGLPPYSVGWVAQCFRARFGAFPDWSLNRAVAREFGVRI